MVKIDSITIEYFYENESEAEDLKRLKLPTTSSLIANRVYLNHEDIVQILITINPYIDYDLIFYRQSGNSEYILLQKQ